MKIFQDLYSGIVYDAIKFDIKYEKPFVLRKEIKRGWSFNNVLFGPAFTCKGEKILNEKQIQDNVRIEMIKKFYKGCVQVISSGGYRDVAQYGDISGKVARKNGAIGAVVDAPIRDIKIIEKDGFPVFCDGFQPIDAYGKWQIVEYEVPIVIDGIDGDVVINPADYIFGDADGVLVIPSIIINKIERFAIKRLQREEQVRKEIKSVDDIMELYERIGRW